MKTFIIITITVLLSSFNSCEKNEIVSQNDDEKILAIKHTLYKDILGYDLSELIIDTTSARYIAYARYSLPEIDTSFNISNNEWNMLVNSFSLNEIINLDTIY